MCCVTYYSGLWQARFTFDARIFGERKSFRNSCAMYYPMKTEWKNSIRNCVPHPQNMGWIRINSWWEKTAQFHRNFLLFLLSRTTFEIFILKKLEKKTRRVEFGSMFILVRHHKQVYLHDICFSEAKKMGIQREMAKANDSEITKRMGVKTYTCRPHMVKFFWCRCWFDRTEVHLFKCINGLGIQKRLIHRHVSIFRRCCLHCKPHTQTRQVNER